MKNTPRPNPDAVHATSEIYAVQAWLMRFTAKLMRFKARVMRFSAQSEDREAMVHLNYPGPSDSAKTPNLGDSARGAKPRSSVESALVMPATCYSLASR